MSKKVFINGKWVIVKDADVKEGDADEEDEEGADEEGADDEGGADDVAVQKTAKKIAQQVVKNLDLGNVSELNEKVDRLMKMNNRVDEKMAKILNGKDLSKDELTKEEKIVAFYHALVSKNDYALKALAEGVDADGGYLFPDEFRAELVRDISDIAVMRSLVRVVPMRRNVLNIPTLATKPKVYWTNENATKTTTTATFSQATLTVKKMAAILYASDELIDDSTEIDVVNTIITLFAESIADEEDRVITAGNGSTEPTGLTTALSNSAIASTACVGNLDFDNIIRLVYLLPTKYRRNASFLVHTNNIRELRLIKDSQNRYLWQDAVAPGQPSTFYGYPVVENNWMPEATIFFGDFRQGYWLGDRQRMTVKISNDTETAFTRDQTAIRVVCRIAGNVVLGAAIKALTTIP